MPSFLIFGGSYKLRAEKTLKIGGKYELVDLQDNVDAINIEPEEGKKNIGIDQIRVANKFLTERPVNHKYKFIFIKKADLLTLQAQNALLKTLEEPPEYANIFLLTKTENSLITTVVSRCKKIKADENKEVKQAETSIFNILNLTTGDKLAYASELSGKEKEEIIFALEGWVAELRKALTYSNGENIKEILRIKNSLEQTSVATKLALENLMLRLKANPKT